MCRYCIHVYIHVWLYHRSVQLLLGVPLMDHTLLDNPHHQIGNAMHVGVFVLLQLSVYANTRVHRNGLPWWPLLPSMNQHR